MICPVCFGRKYDFKKDGNSGYFVECKKCHGTGIVEPQTHEEWFCQLSTEEKARWLADNFGFVAYKASGGNPQRVKEDLVEYWQEWLKQPHTFE